MSISSVFRATLTTSGDMVCLRHPVHLDCWLVVNVKFGSAYVRTMSSDFQCRFVETARRLRGNHHAHAPSLTLDVAVSSPSPNAETQPERKEEEDAETQPQNVVFILSHEQTELLRAETSVDKIAVDVWRSFAGGCINPISYP